MWFILFLFLSLTSFASERILLFESNITIHPDATMTVQETIKVRATGHNIKRGIVREFPTIYKNRWGNTYQVGFHIKEITRDGHQEPYRIEPADNGKKIYMGDPDIWLEPGMYTYTITYVTNRQLGFFEDQDELYWNVTGNGWRLPIDQAIAIVHLPPDIPRNQITLEGYTGYQGSKEQNFQAFINEQGDPVFQITRPLRRQRGLTIVVAWPKGYIQQPSWLQQWKWFFTDNVHIFIALLGLFCLLAWYIFAWIRFRSTQQIATIIPLFYPPKGMTPGLVRYIVNRGYDAKVLAADIVDMAVHGFLTIEYTKHFFTGQYTLHAQKKPSSEYKQYIFLYDNFFSKKESLLLGQKSSQRIQVAVDIEEKAYSAATRDYLQSSGWDSFIGIAMAIGFCLLLLPFIDASSQHILFFAAIGYGILVILFYKILQGYTKKGLDIKKEIDGFKMFLATTEQERLKIIGTPPTKTPELYEKYLPYAIALGVEKQWSQQFAPLFEKMREAGHPYVFVWFTGTDFDAFAASSFASNLSNSISSSVISSSQTVPGSSSGSGGRGSSGGGGGGGGGGGW
jgi:hypothetical protein